MKSNLKYDCKSVYDSAEMQRLTLSALKLRFPNNLMLSIFTCMCLRHNMYAGALARHDHGLCPVYLFTRSLNNTVNYLNDQASA